MLIKNKYLVLLQVKNYFIMPVNVSFSLTKVFLSSLLNHNKQENIVLFIRLSLFN